MPYVYSDFLYYYRRQKERLALNSLFSGALSIFSNVQYWIHFCTRSLHVWVSSFCFVLIDIDTIAIVHARNIITYVAAEWKSMNGSAWDVNVLKMYALYRGLVFSLRPLRGKCSILSLSGRQLLPILLLSGIPFIFHLAFKILLSANFRNWDLLLAV